MQVRHTQPPDTVRQPERVQLHLHREARQQALHTAVQHLRQATRVRRHHRLRAQQLHQVQRQHVPEKVMQWTTAPVQELHRVRLQPRHVQEKAR